MRTAFLIAALLAIGATAAHTHGGKHAQAASQPAEQTDWGIMGERRAVGRTITVDMTDNMRFTPDRMTVREGETVRFVVRNKGRMLHEMVIGTAGELARHAALMARFPGMQHDEAYMVHVDPGQSGEIVWHFNRAGRFEFACLIAGHYEAGMRGTLVVTSKEGDEK